MSGILPSASNHPVWSPIAGEIHTIIWDRVGLEIVQGIVRKWASNWNAEANSAKVMKKEPWQALNPALPLPPSPHKRRSLAEKWASLAALHDVYDLTGDTVLPWPLPEDDLDLVAYAKWIRGEAGAYQLLMRKAIALPPNCERNIRRWLTDVCKDTLPKESNDLSQLRDLIEAAVASGAKSKGKRRAVGEAKAKKKEVEKDLCIAWETFYRRTNKGKAEFLKQETKWEPLIRQYFRDEMKTKGIKEILTLVKRIIDRN